MESTVGDEEDRRGRFPSSVAVSGWYHIAPKLGAYPRFVDTGVGPVLQRVFKALGLRLVHRKLAQIVPIAGVAINGALGAHLTQHLYQRADDVYRVRFLSEKYGLDAEEWLVGYSVEDETEEGAVAETDILEILEEELRIDREGPEVA